MMIKNCLITGTDAEIVKTFSSNSAFVNSMYPGVNIQVNGHVHSQMAGQVVLVDKKYGKYSVIIQHMKNRFMKYSNLDKVSVDKGIHIFGGSEIGSARSYVKVEYITDSPSLFPVRIINTTYFKNDPMDIIQTGVEGTLRAGYYGTYSPTGANSNIDPEADHANGINDEVDYTLSNNRGS